MSESLRDELYRRAWHELDAITRMSNYASIEGFMIVRNKYSMRIVTEMRGLQIIVFRQGYTDKGEVVNPVPADELVRILRQRQVLGNLANV